MKGFVLINTRTGEVREVVRTLRKVAGVEAAHVTFGPYDVVALVKAENVRALGELITGAIQPIPGVEETLTCLAVDEG